MGGASVPKMTILGTRDEFGCKMSRSIPQLVDMWSLEVAAEVGHTEILHAIALFASRLL